jgi:cation diffusion facilitator family transporter
MSENCCQSKGKDLEKIRKQHSKVLWIVLFINITMFVIELINGIRANSLALTGDSLDMLGDSLVYGSSLLVVYKSQKAQARVSLLKGFIMIGSALTVLIRGLYQFHIWSIPVQQTMTNIGIIALVANLSCLIFLTRHKEDNLNMSSVWICSRNDIIANSSVLLAAWIISIYPSPIPDLIVGLLITFVFTKSSLRVIKASQRELLVEIK